MRIAISGTAGTGKSSLAKTLAERLGLSLIEENYGILFDKPEKFTDSRQRAAAILQIFSSKRQIEEQHGSFVTDRCPVDLFHFWMKAGLWTRTKETEQLCSMAAQQVGQYDLLVLPPSGMLNADSVHEAGDFRKRNSNQHVQLYNHASIVGLAVLWAPADRLLFLPNIRQSVDERVEEVIKFVSSHKARSH